MKTHSRCGVQRFDALQLVLRVIVLSLFVSCTASAIQIIYVNKNSPTSNGDGSSWATAYRKLDSAIAAANPTPSNPVEIWIAKGTYYPAGTGKSATFSMRSHLSLVGGFAGTETSVNQRLFSNMTVLSGDIAQNDANAITDANALNAMVSPGSTNYLSDPKFNDNAYNVISAVNCTNVLLESLVITGGNANSDGNASSVNAATQMLTVSTSNPTENAAPIFDSKVTGGGLFVVSAHENYIPYYGVLVANCQFINNAAVLGGGVGSRRGKMGFMSCTFRGNYAVVGGGAIYEQDPSAIVESSDFNGNFSSGDGGAIKYVTFAHNDGGDPAYIRVNDTAYGILQRSVETDFRTPLNNTMAAILGSREAFNEMTRSNVSEADISSTLTAVGNAYVDYLNVQKPLDTEGVSLADFAGVESGIEAGVFFVGNTFATAIMANTSLGDNDISHRIAKRKRLQELFHFSPETGLLRTEFTGNKAAVGGAISIQHANIYFDVCSFEQNQASLAGGAVYASLYDRVKFVSCGFNQNSAGKGFSAILAAVHTRLHLLNCTFTQNSSSSSSAGHAVGMTSGAESDIANCIFWSNTSPGKATGRADVFTATEASIGSTIYSAMDANYGEVVAYTDLRYSCVESLTDLAPGRRYTVPAYSPFEENTLTAKFTSKEKRIHQASFTFTKVNYEQKYFMQEGGAVELGEGYHENVRNNHGNISSNPLLVGKYKIAFNSPALDTGTNRTEVDEMIVSSATGLDLDRNPRLKGTNVDMGVIEGGAFGNLIYVNYAATGLNNGTSWQNAFTNLSSALSRQDVEVWVAKGTYYPTTNYAGGADPRDKYFQLPDRVRVFGGFAGSETSVSQRNIDANPTILSGDLGVKGNDSDNAYSVVFNNGGSRTVLDGFTITKGRGWSGAGMFNQNSSTEVKNCKFVDNIAEGFGGAFCSFGTGTPSFYNCVFSNNVAQRYSGGAMKVDSSMRVDNCTFIGNTALSGGAIQFEPSASYNFCYIQNSLFAKNTITNGYNQAFGAGVHGRGDMRVVNCTFSANKIVANTSASPHGAGLHYGGWGGGHLTVSSSIFWGNVVANSGAGKTSVELQEFSLESVSPGQIYVRDNIIQDFSKSEEAYYYSNLDVDPQFVNPAAGDFRLTQFSPAIDRCPSDGSIPKLDLAQAERFFNAIAAPNAAGTDLVLDMGAYEYQSAAVQVPTLVRTTRICGDPTSTYRFDLDLGGKSLAGTTLQWEVNTNGQGYVPVSGGNYSGGTTATLTVSGVTIAMNGHRFRVRGIGALAFSSSSVVMKVSPPVLYVTENGSGDRSGTSWANAFRGLKSALDAAGGCQQIWVAKGTYKPGTNVDDSFIMRSGISIYGGFAGSETNLAQRNWTNNITLFSAEVGNAETNSDNCRNIFSNNGVITDCDSSAILDGCTLEGALYSAVFNFDAYPTIRNCVFRKNGQPVYTTYTGNIPGLVLNQLIDNCVFENNTRPSYFEKANPTIRNSIFRGNTGTPAACLDVNTKSVVSVINSKFERNVGSRGGVASVSDSDVSLVNCLMHHNETSFRGGAIWSGRSILRVKNSTIADNIATYSGGGIHSQESGTNYIYNSILWDNSDQSGGGLYAGQFSVDSKVSMIISNSCVQGLSVASSGNTFYDPLFLNSVASNYNLTASSPLLDAGSSALASGITTDLAGNNRSVHSSVDMGAYEFQTAKGIAMSLLSAPKSYSTCGAGSVAAFSVTGLNNPSIVYQWQVNTGSGFSNVDAGGIYSITTTSNSSILRISSAPLSMSGYQYRVTVAANNFASFPVTLTVKPANILKVYRLGNSTDGSTWGTAFTNLQQAINAADGCTEIWVAKGSYHPSGTDYYTMKSGVAIYGGFNATENTRDQRNLTNNIVVLNNSGANPIFRNSYSANNAIDSTAILDGFTLAGSSSNNAAIENWRTSPTFRNCRFVANVGKSLDNYQSSSVITNCVFTNNFNTPIANRDSSPTIQGSLFVDNTASTSGAIENSSASPTIQDCVFRNNKAFSGGAIANGYGSSPTISRCSFINNSTTSRGGAIVNHDGSEVVVNNCLFNGNVAGTDGGAIYHRGTMTLVNSTLSGNRSVQSGGAAYLDGGTATLLNTILWENIGEEFGRAPALEQGQIRNGGASLVISNSCVQGLTLYATNNNIGYDPLFVHPPSGDFRLLSSSPCIDAGNNGFHGSTNDLSKANRLAGAAVDIGAYEFPGLPTNTIRLATILQSKNICVGDNTAFTLAKAAGSSVELVWQVDGGAGFVNATNVSGFSVTSTTTSTTLAYSGSLSPTNYQVRLAGANTSFTTPTVNLAVKTPGIVYVNVGATGLNNGSSWLNAFTNLQQAASSVAGCAQVWVAQGTYKTTGVDGSGYLRLKSGMALYGGFVGTETTLAQRNWTNQAAVIVGGIASVYNPAAGYSDPIDGTAVLDGFFISDTNATSLYNDQASPTIRNCTFARNTAPSIWNDNGSLPTIQNCTFTNNAEIGILSHNGSSPLIAGCRFVNNRSTSIKTEGLSAPVITNCVFTGNMVSNGFPAVIWNQENVSAVISHSRFDGNFATGEGGAIYNRLSSPVLENLLFAKNQAKRGGAIYHSGGNITLKNCTIAGNSSVGFGGGILNASGVVRLENSILWDNAAPDSATDREAQQLKGTGGTFIVLNSCVEGLRAYVGSNNIASDPIFVDFAAGNLRLQAISPALNAGSNAFASSITGDLDNNQRVFGSAVDMGAYELQSAAQAPVYIYTQPKSIAACEGGGIRFTVQGVTNSGASYQWQINGGSGFTNLLSSDFVNIGASGDSSTLALDSVSPTLSTNPIRYVYGSYTSAPVTVTVSTPSVAYVKLDATGTGDGSSWTNAFTNLRDAINAAGSCTELWVAQGTYASPSVLTLKNGLAIYGGFAGNETGRNQRNWTNRPTILSGTSSGWVFYNDGTYGEIDQRAVLDGFIISGANAYAAIANRFASPTIRNCVFTNNLRNAISSQNSKSFIFNSVFTGNGGGLNNDSSDVRVVSCVFSNNVTPKFNSGSAMNNRDSSPLVEKSVFISNKAESGGAVYNYGSSTPTFLRCVFGANFAQEGGAAFNTGTTTVTFRDCLFAANFAQSRGGAIVHYGGALNLVNCTVVDNASSVGGGIYLQATGNIRNSILWYNSASHGDLETRQIERFTGSPLAISHSSVQGLSVFIGNNNTAEEPLFIARTTGNYQLKVNSPVINGGNNSFSSSLLDLANNTRVAAGTIDLGAYEYQGAPSNTLHFTELPQSITKCEGNNALFKAVGIPGGGYNYQWQKFNGVTFVNITNGGPYTITVVSNSGSLLVEGVSLGMTGDRFRVVETTSGFTSSEAVLTVIRPSIIYVNQNVATPGSGENWASAFARLEDAIAAGNECSQIWVASGTYTPTNAAGESIFLECRQG